MTFPAGTFRPDPHRASTRTMLDYGDRKSVV